jgi:hypothetical protein
MFITLFSIWSCNCLYYARFDKWPEELISFSIHLRHPNIRHTAVQALEVATLGKSPETILSSSEQHRI